MSRSRPKKKPVKRASLVRRWWRWSVARKINGAISVLVIIVTLAPPLKCAYSKFAWKPIDEVDVSPASLLFERLRFGEQVASESHKLTVRNKGTKTVYRVEVRLLACADVQDVDVKVRPNRNQECAVWQRTDVSAVLCREAPDTTSLWLVIKRLSPGDSYDFSLSCSSTDPVAFQASVHNASLIPDPQISIKEEGTETAFFPQLPPVRGAIMQIFFPCALETGEIPKDYPVPIPHL